MLIYLKKLLNNLTLYLNIVFLIIIILFFSVSIIHILKINVYDSKLSNSETYNVIVSHYIDEDHPEYDPSIQYGTDIYTSNPEKYVEFYDYVLNNTKSVNLNIAHDRDLDIYVFFHTLYENDRYSTGIHVPNNINEELCDMLIEGNCLDKNSYNDILVSESFAYLNNIGIGDSVVLGHQIYAVTDRYNFEGYNYENPEVFENEYNIVGIVEDYEKNYSTHEERINGNQGESAEISSYIYLPLNKTIDLARDKNVWFAVSVDGIDGFEVDADKLDGFKNFIKGIFANEYTDYTELHILDVTTEEAAESNSIGEFFEITRHFFIILSLILAICVVLFIYIVKRLINKNIDIVKIRHSSGASYIKLVAQGCLEFLVIMLLSFGIFYFVLVDNIIYILNYYIVFSMDEFTIAYNDNLYNILTSTREEIMYSTVISLMFTLIIVITCYLIKYYKKGLIDD